MLKNSVLALLLVTMGPWCLDAQVSRALCTPDCDGPVSWKLLVPNILQEQKDIWLFPGKLGKDHVWVPTLAIAGTTSALLAADPYEGKYFNTTSSFRDFNNVFTSDAMSVGTYLAPAALYGAGLLWHDSKLQRTALFSGEAVANTEILATALKAITRRTRPFGIAPGGNYRGTFFQTKGSPASSSFPSGHTIAAFAVATVVAHRYANHRWVPYVVYGGAALVGFSRLSLSEHFVSDVFAGAALGYTVSRFAVLRY
jgi:membrane-associated phospholipid phosphatase